MSKINYFQEGGAVAPQAASAAAQPQQSMEQQVVALVLAAMQGDQQATQTINQIMQAALQGDQQAAQIAQMIQAVAQQMQGQAQQAKYGAKVEYLRKLNTGCKADEELTYYKKGGQICKACMKKAEAAQMEKCGGKAEKAACGTKAPVKKACGGLKTPIKKCGGKTKKK